MQSKTAAEYVRRIEEHREAEELIWQEMRARYDFEANEDKDIRYILDNRAKARALTEEADAMIAGFDYREEDE